MQPNKVGLENRLAQQHIVLVDRAYIGDISLTHMIIMPTMVSLIPKIGKLPSASITVTHGLRISA